MTPLRRARRRRPPLPAAALAATLAGAIGVVAGLPGTAGAIGEEQVRDGRSPYDQRAAAVSAGAASVTPSTAARALARQLGPEGIVELDPISGTPRRVLRTDGALTGPSDDAPAEIVLRYVREHRAVFRLDDAAIAALGTPVDVVSPTGTHRLRWTQRHAGVPVLDAELRGHVAADGRLLAVLGGPLPDPAVASTAPAVSASGALGRARRDTGLTGGLPAVATAGGGAARRTTFSDGSTAQLVVYPGAGGNRLAWKVIARTDDTHVYSYALDATSGAVLARHNMVRYASAAGRAWEYVPSPAIARNGGHNQVLRTFGNDWISDDFNGLGLYGENAFAYSDVNDAGYPPDVADSVPSTSGDGTPGAPFIWDYPFTPAAGPLCDPDYPCSWAFGTANSWRANREQNAVQAFWFVNRFHDHLLEDPIGFDEASGNFELNNAPGVGAGGDPVLAETDDGANTGGGLPDANHSNNANMWTPADGSPPVMQMYLFGGGAFAAANGGDDASVVYHEYGHGLSNRLVTDNSGEGAVWFPQAGAMGEAWSDWYALDFLEAQGLQADDPGVDGEIVLGGYLARNRNLLRDASIDCPVGSAAPNCARGGFTFGDYGRIWGGGGPQVHADGEIWGQTLWDLRAALIERYGSRAIGVRTARMLVTEGMRDLPPQPSFLDARDAIVAEAAAVTGRPDHDLVWAVFARRGMGWSASTVDAYDPAPFEAFDLPPSGPATASLRGTVTDAQTGAPLPNATVKLPGQGGAETTTGADGRYLLNAIVATRYPRVLVTRPGYDDAAPTPVDVAADGSVHDTTLRRNFALSSGGTQVSDVTAPVYEPPCAPQDAIDGTFAHGWASYAPGYDGRDSPFLPDVPLGPRSLVLRLPQAIDVSSVAIDPGAVCGDDDSASLGEYLVETRDGGAWREALRGRFGRDRTHRMNVLTPAAGTTQGVTAVQVTMIRPQGGPGSSDEEFMDMAELAIYGSAVRPTGPPDPPLPPDPGPPAQPRQPDPTPPANPAPPTVPAPPVRPSARDGRGPTLAGVRLQPARGGLRALTGRGLKLTLRCSDEPCRVGATVTLPAATARTLGLTRRRGGAPFVLARASGRGFVAANRPATLTLRVSRAVARRLARTTRLTPSIAVTATDAAGNATPTKLKPRLRR